MKKNIQNIDSVTCKLEPALIKVTNHRLENVTREKEKSEIIVKKRKAESVAAKRYKIGREIDLSSAKKSKYESNTKDNINSDKANDKYLL